MTSGGNKSDEEKWIDLTRHERLGEVLLKHGKITLKQLSELMAEQEKTGRTIGDLVLLRGIMSRQELLEALNWQHIADRVSLESMIELTQKQKEEDEP